MIVCMTHSTTCTNTTPTTTPSSLSFRAKAMQATRKVHVDKNIVVLNANTSGYEAYEHEGGGALIQSFSKVWSDNADALDFDEMCRGINSNLESIGAASGRSQAMERIGMGLTKRIVFLRLDGQKNL